MLREETLLPMDQAGYSTPKVVGSNNFQDFQTILPTSPLGADLVNPLDKLLLQIPLQLFQQFSRRQPAEQAVGPAGRLLWTGCWVGRRLVHGLGKERSG